MTNSAVPPRNWLLALGFLTSQVTAHGYVQGIVAQGQFYQGYRPSFQYLPTPPALAGWSDPQNINNGFITDYSSPDIICHLGATPGQAYVSVEAGSQVELQWTPWPVGHLGPVISYLANCNGNCTQVDKTQLLFNKIDAVGLLSGQTTPGSWAAGQLAANNNSWTLTIPSSIAPGNYVLRHEIIALQEAMALGKAQNYPQCINLQITGSGTNSLQSGTPGTQLYKSTDPGLYIDIYQTLANYTIPGPPLLGSLGSDNTTQPISSSSFATATPFPNTTTSAPYYFNTSTTTTTSSSPLYLNYSVSTTATMTTTATTSTASSDITSQVSGSLGFATVTASITVSLTSTTAAVSPAVFASSQDSTSVTSTWSWTGPNTFSTLTRSSFWQSFISSSQSYQYWPSSATTETASTASTSTIVAFVPGSGYTTVTVTVTDVVFTMPAATVTVAGPTPNRELTPTTTDISTGTLPPYFFENGTSSYPATGSVRTIGTIGTGVSGVPLPTGTGSVFATFGAAVDNGFRAKQRRRQLLSERW